MDYVLQGTIKTLSRADAKDFSFSLLSVNAKEIPIAKIESNVTKPTGWTIKTIAVADSSFGYVTGAGSSQKITLKKGGTFTINITVQKTDWVDYVLSGSIKADHSVFYLNFNKATKEITGLTKGSKITTLNIPSEIDGVAVTGIAKNSFKFNDVLTSVTIPNSVTAIGDWAFYKCTKLASITLSNSLLTIGEHVFRQTGLTSITLPNSLTAIPASTFLGCISLTTITLSEKITSIGDYAFEKCTKLTVTMKQTNPSSIGLGKSPLRSVKQIKVPKANLAAYKAATGWSAYASKMVGY